MNSPHTLAFERRKIMLCKTLIIASLAFGFVGLCRGDDRARPAKPRFGGSKWNVAIVIYDGMEILDFAGPAETFQAAGAGQKFYVKTVSDTLRPIVSQGFVMIKPQYTVAECPPPDMVVIPGGNARVAMKNKKLMAWVKAAARDAQRIFSVCSGAFVLAEAGLLDGLEATSHHSALARLRKDYPRIKVRDDLRVVDNGKIVTAAGVSAGIDGALHLVDKMCGQTVAKRTAEYMEYRWLPESMVQSEASSKDGRTQPTSR
jgi:transcriptional regulator GlxA family with amidase domain